MSERVLTVNYAKSVVVSIVIGMTIAMTTVAQAGDIVRIGGAGTGLGAMIILADDYEKLHPGTKIKVLPSLGSSGGIKALLNGAIDIALSGRMLKPEEQLEGVVAIEYAKTPFVFIVNRGVNKADVTTSEVERIYSGELLKWSDGSRIRLILRPENEADTILVKSISKKMEQAVTLAKSRSDISIAVSNQDSDDAVSKIPGAFGGSAVTQIVTEKRPVKILSFNGITPTLENISSKRYPLVKPLLLVTASGTSAAAQSFIKFVSSAQGRALLLKSGSVPTLVDKKVK